MTAVIRLIPGDQVDAVWPGAVFIAQTVHPIWPNLQLVVWRMADGSWSHDALSPAQDVGPVKPASDHDRDRRLREALLGEAAANGSRR